MSRPLPDFQNIDLQNAEKNLESLLSSNLKAIDALCMQEKFTWDNLMRPLEALSDTLHQFWSPINHLSTVVNTKELRDLMNACLPKLSDYHTHLTHHEQLYRAISSIEIATLSAPQKAAIAHELRDFKLNGVDLSAEKRLVLLS